jgi:hypothetical protein
LTAGEAAPSRVVGERAGVLGDVLRQARLRKRVSLEQASEDTKIRLKFLRALEAGDYPALPGAVYTKGFLRSYGEYLRLEPDELVALYHGDRALPEPPQRLDPIVPIERRAMVFTPAIVAPVVITALVVLFLVYFYLQFVSFVVPPRLEVLEPAADAIVQRTEFVLRGSSVPEGKISVTVFPGSERYTIRAEGDGSFSVPIKLKPGPNHVDVSVLDAAGKANAVARTITVEPAATSPSGAPLLLLDLPANGSSFTDTPVTVAGRIDPKVATLLVNGTEVRAETDGRFSTALALAPGAQTVRVVARESSGAEAVEHRAITVAYTRAFVMVQLRGGSAWLQAFVDGAQDNRTNRVYSDGQLISFIGREVRVRTGNGGVTYLTFNGENLGVMGQTGQVAERTFSLP